MATKFHLQPLKLDRADADVLVLLIRGPHAGSPVLTEAEKATGVELGPHLILAEFDADKGSVVDLGMMLGNKAVHVVIVGVKSPDGGDTARFSEAARTTEAVAVGVRTALAHRPGKVLVIDTIGDARSLGLGAGLGAYRFEKYLTKKSPPLKEVVVSLLDERSGASTKEFALGVRISEGVCLARDLINEPPNVLTPAEFARRAKLVAQKNGLAAKVMNHAQLRKAGMLLHDAVGRGSDNEPYFIHLAYTPAQSKGRIAFVGKGLTFDSGGLCIKPAPSMGDMKSDMSGGAAVLGLMEVIAALKLPVEVHGIIGAAENMPDAKAYRPADVIVGLGGKGVEVINTDAEGRLVLADALVYAARLQPDFMLDAATLTGATLLSLSPSCSAYFTSNEGIAAAMAECSSEAGESFWRMPLIEELTAQLKSSVTDLQHTGDRMGGAITAALFLREFTEGVPWVHLDIPGAVYRDRAVGMHPKGGTGHGVLTFLGLVERHARSLIVQRQQPAKGGRRSSSETHSSKSKSPSKRQSSAKSRRGRAANG